MLRRKFDDYLCYGFKLTNDRLYRHLHHSQSQLKDIGFIGMMQKIKLIFRLMKHMTGWVILNMNVLLLNIQLVWLNILQVQKQQYE